MAIAAKHRATVLGVTIIAVLVFLSGWAFYNKSQASNVTKDKPLTIGISPPFANPLKEAVAAAKQQGINVKLVEFTDWNT
ncbi:MAG TPA: methionine transporter, partial [Moraxellaceae bacterium]|nr:methionine transporter [Moraxellaceae bacterium]